MCECLYTNFHEQSYGTSGVRFSNKTIRANKARRRALPGYIRVAHQATPIFVFGACLGPSGDYPFRAHLGLKGAAPPAPSSP